MEFVLGPRHARVEAVNHRACLPVREEAALAVKDACAHAAHNATITDGCWRGGRCAEAGGQGGKDVVVRPEN
jgi:hypothetical protein